MKIFVTGANGFIGREFCTQAAAAGHEVLGMVRQLPANWNPPANVKLVIGSLENMPWSAVALFQPSVALHLAWHVEPGTWMHSPQNEFLQRTSQSLFQGLANMGVAHLAATGTCLEYACSALPLPETAPVTESPLPYTQAKLATLHHLETEAETAGALWSWFRLFYCYGEGDDPRRLISHALPTLARGETVRVHSPHSFKDYIHVSDVAAGILWALERKLGGICNLGTGVGTSIMELVQTAARTVGADQTLISYSQEASQDPMPVAIADISKLRLANWQPKLTLRQGLERTWLHLHSH